MHPVPVTYAVLLLALPGVYFAGRWLAQEAWPNGPRVLALLVAASGWLLAVHAVGRLSHSFRFGLVVGTLLLAAVGFGVELRARRTRQRAPDQPGIDWKELVWVAATTGLVAPLALRFHFHDEVWITGHMSIASEILGGVYPPRYLEFPDLELRYHYFFDLASAIVGATTRLPVDSAIDVVTLAGLAATTAACWALGASLSIRRVALVPLLVTFCFGFPYLSVAAGTSPEARLLGYGAAVAGSPLNAPTLSYLFQHPWSLGLPLSVTLLVLVLERRTPSVARYAVFTLLLACLAMSQIVLFACLAATLFVTEAWDHGTSFDRKRALGFGSATGLAVAIGFASGGFFLGSPGGRDELSLHFGVADSLGGTLLWHVADFGLLLPLGLVGLWRMQPRARLLVALLLSGSLGVVNFVRYAHSADILKFATVSTLALSLAAASALAGLVERASRKVRLAGWSASALTTLGGFASVAVFYAGGRGIPAELLLRPARPTADDAAAIAWLRQRVQAAEIVCVLARTYPAYYQWGGLPTPYLGPMSSRLGLPVSRIEARVGLLENATAPARLYLDQGIRWFVVADGVKSPTGQWLASGQAHEVERFGSLQVVELGPPERP